MPPQHAWDFSVYSLFKHQIVYLILLYLSYFSQYFITQIRTFLFPSSLYKVKGSLNRVHGPGRTGFAYTCPRKRTLFHSLPTHRDFRIFPSAFPASADFIPLTISADFLPFPCFQNPFLYSLRKLRKVQLFIFLQITERKDCPIIRFHLICRFTDSIF